MPPPDETYRGVEKVAHTLVVGFETSLNTSCNFCTISRDSQAKMASKCIRIASTDILNLKLFSGEIPRTPLTKGGPPPLVLSPTRAFGMRRTPMPLNGRTTFQNPTTALKLITPFPCIQLTVNPSQCTYFPTSANFVCCTDIVYIGKLQ